jgi:hypothetical protein
MTGDLGWRLEELQEQAASLSAVMSSARDGMAAGSEGVDRSRSVRVGVGQDGLPTRFQVAPDWQRRLPPGAFGDAVVEAYSVAIGARLVDWVAGLQRPPSRRPPAPSGFARQPSYVAPRPLEDVIEDLLRSFDDLERAERPAVADPGARGSAGNGRLTLTLSPTALTGCTADPRWTADQTGARLTMALTEALEDARTRLPLAPRTVMSAERLDGLFAETMALLADSARLGR